MSSKLFNGITLSLLVLCLGSCSLPVNEVPPTTSSPETKIGFEKKCLAEVLPTLHNYIEGSAKPQAVTQVWNCFGGAIDIFYKKVKGSQKDEYSPREVAQFFEEYFFEDLKISDSLLNQVMQLKQILIGGRADNISKADLRRLLDFASEARELSLDLLPYMKVLSLHWKLESRDSLARDIEYFEAANLKLQNVAHRLGRRIEANHRTYRTENLVLLLEEIQNLYGEKWSTVERAREVLPLILNLKKSLVGGDQEVISAHEWRPFHLLIARGYIQYLRYRYFIADAPDDAGSSDLIYITRSIDDLFSYLGDMVREKPGSRLTKTELLQLLKSVRAIFPRFEVSEELIEQGMKLKQLLFGGNTESWTPEEFERARAKVEAFRGVSQRVYAYLPFYTMNWRPEDMPEKEAFAYFEEGEKNLIELGTRLGQILETQYDLADFSKFAHELEKVFPPTTPADQGLGERVDQYLPLIVGLKKMIAGDASTIVMRTDWTMILSAVGELYGRGLYYNYYIKARPISLGRGLVALEHFEAKIVETLRFLLLRRESRGLTVISLSEIQELVLGAEHAQLLPKNLPAKVVVPLVPILFNKILLPARERIGQRLPNGLGFVGLDYAHSEFLGWVQIQKQMEQIFQGRAEILQEELAKAFLSFGTSAADFEMSRSLTSPIPLVRDETGRLNLSGQRSVPYTLHATEKLNFSRLIVRILNNAVITDLGRLEARQGFSVAEANVLFFEVKPLFVQIGMLEESNMTFVDNRCLEANLFTPHADGSDFVNFQEAVDLVQFIFSGLEMDSELKEHYQKECQIFSGADPLDQRISLRCYLNVHRQYMEKVFEQMPEMAMFLRSLRWGLKAGGDAPLAVEELSSYEYFMINIVKAAGWDGDSSGLVKLTDLSLVPHVIQYIEATLIRLDADRSQVLSRREALEGYPTFRGVLQTVAKSNKDNILKGAYAYILVNGKAPETTKEKAYFILVWVNKESSWPIQADRAQLAKVLGYIADSVKKSKKPGAVAEAK